MCAERGEHFSCHVLSGVLVDCLVFCCLHLRFVLFFHLLYGLNFAAVIVSSPLDCKQDKLCMKYENEISTLKDRSLATEVILYFVSHYMCCLD